MKGHATKICDRERRYVNVTEIVCAAVVILFVEVPMLAIVDRLILAERVELLG